MKKISLLIIGILISFHALTQDAKVNPERQWTGYRGYYSNGHLDEANLPGSWNAEKGTNILWKIDIPGLALSSPIIWGKKLFISTAVSEKDTSGLRTFMSGSVQPIEDQSHHEWKVYCLNKNTGEIIWEDTPVEGIPQVKRHPMSTHANTTLATDGKHVVVFFGSEGLFCYDMEGNLLWDKNFGLLKSVFFIAESAEWEFASSPIIHKNTVIVLADVLENSFVAAFDIDNGEQLWKANRDEFPGWSTPNIFTSEGKDRVVVNGFKHRGAYDFKTGEEIWKMSGGGDIPVPTPVVSDDLIYFNSAHGRSSPILAIRETATGDITLSQGDTTNAGVKWSYPRGGSYMHTMLLYKGYLYNVRLNGQVQCLNATTGEELYKEKIGKAEFFLSSPVASDNKIYITSVPGLVYTIEAGPEFKIINESPLGDVCMTTPALTDNIIFFRTEKHLIAISNK